MFFRDVIGHKELVETLVSSVKSGRMGHALLFAGSNDCGSLALALGLARYVLCTGDKTSDACGECPSCRKMDKFVHPDLHFVFPVWLKEASSVSDDFIREWRLLLSEGAYFDSGLWGLRLNAENKQLIIPAAESGSILGKLSLKAFESDFKIMLIWLPEKMNLEASNALLKIVEEPYEKAFFFLVTENLPAILPTIRSRTQIIHVPRIDIRYKRQVDKRIGFAGNRGRDLCPCRLRELAKSMRHVERTGRYDLQQGTFYRFYAALLAA